MAAVQSHPPELSSAQLHNHIDGDATDMTGESEALASEMSGLTITDRSRPRRLPRPDMTHFHSDRAFMSRPDSPTGSIRSSYTTRRRMSRESWSGGGFQRHHRSEVSKELTAQAEGEFFALTEIMANMSRRSLSLKEVWNKIKEERDSCYSEIEWMSERFDEMTETIERKDREHGHHNHEHEERKQELVKIRLELTAALNSATDFKKRVVERDNECRTLRHEIAETRDSLTYTRKEHEETKKTSEQTRLALIATEAARFELEDKCGKLRGERDSLDLKYTELQSRYSELGSKFESTHKELVQVKQTNMTLKKEKHEWLHNEGELEEKLRKSEHKHDELRRKFKELEELYEKKKHEFKDVQETMTRVKHEKEEIEQIVERLKREVEEEHGRWQEAEDRCGKWKLKWEHSEREIVSVREELSRIEITQTELQEVISKKTEELHLLIIEKKRIQEEGDRASSRADENHRQLLLVQETLSHTESMLRKTEEEMHSKTERIERLELDYTVARDQVKDLEIEIENHRSSVATLRLEIGTLTGQCGALKEKCHDWERKYEDVYESVTEYEEGSSGYEFELSSLRTMLRETREQKELAITARNTADRERDEAIGRFEEKCREMERLEERMSAQLHEQSHRSGTRTVTRSFKSSRATAGGDDHSSSEESC
ncbi:hypothetical protein EsH8_II_001495 [Colletotrichum jinshuiense]